ncbi:MAG: hypothetical protein AAF203_10585 [Pseudomonadota bacterium]
MIRYTLAIFVMALGVQGQASDSLAKFPFLTLLKGDLSGQRNITWEVGEYQRRNILGKFVRVGKVYSVIDREEGNGFWIKNDLEIITKPKEVHEALIDRATGEILKYVVDGVEKPVPNTSVADECDTLSEVQEMVTVPAGTFDTKRTVNRCPDDTYALWVNDQDVNMGGHIKQSLLTSDEDPKKHEYKVELTQFGKL